jgi:hypothetical protein
MLHSRTLVATDPKRIELHVDSDSRLAAAVGGAVRFLAESAGMPEEMCREFQEATVRACVETFEAHRDGSHRVELLRFEDRLEVVVAGGAGSSAVRLTRSVVPQS